MIPLLVARWSIPLLLILTNIASNPLIFIPQRYLPDRVTVRLTLLEVGRRATARSAPPGDLHQPTIIFSIFLPLTIVKLFRLLLIVVVVILIIWRRRPRFFVELKL